MKFGKWIAVPKVFRLIRAENYGEAMDAQAIAIFGNDELHIEGLSVTENGISKDDIEALNEFAKFYGHETYTIQRRRGGKLTVEVKKVK